MYVLFLIWSLIGWESPPADDPKKTTLNITVQNIRSKTGTVRIALMKGCANFPDCKPEHTAILEASTGTLLKDFSLDPGDYAVAVYHDVNANGQLDKRMFGIPKEPYGFSNNFRPRLSAPTFDDCKITVGAGGKAISIRLD